MTANDLKYQPCRCRGFTLVELAMVLMIVGLLLGGLIPTLTAQMESQRISETRKQLEEIQQALVGFAIVNGRFPCPADPTTPTGQANGAGFQAGNEYTTGTGSSLTCANVTGNAGWGVLPWATLGVSETDGWGRRFTYRVTTVFADAITANTFGCSPGSNPMQSSFALCSSGNLFVYTDATKTTSIAGNIPAIVVSHGANGLGAYTPAGQQIAGSAGDESENANNDNSFVNHDFTPAFNDQVIWISPNILLNRMVTAGKLP